jgi:lipopolysaccharide/colanic/teichoic acid biosynthesis glycosyltransferase
MRIASGWLPYYAPVDPQAYAQAFAMAVPMWIICCAAVRLYDTHWLLGGPEEYARVVKACTVGVIMLILINFSRRDLELSRGLLLLAWGLSTVFMAGTRFAFRRLIYWLRSHGLYNSRTLIVGVSQHTKSVARQLETTTQTGVHVVGFLDDYLPVGTQVMEMQEVLGTPADLKRLIREHEVQEVIIFPETLSWESFQETMREVSAGLNGTEVRLSPGFYEILTTEVKVSHRSLIPLFTLEGVRITDLDALLKAVVDHTLSAMLLVLFAPLMGLIALLIASVDGRPVFDRPQVLGLRGQRFYTTRFRTGYDGYRRRSFARPLPNNANGPDRPSWLGTFLYRTRLDKLPQLVDVLRGRMSLVGPRAIRVGTEERYGVWLSNLLTVKPGITGPWALSHLPTLEDEVHLNLYYIRYWTIWFDMQVLFQTGLYSLHYRPPAMGANPRLWEAGADSTTIRRMSNMDDLEGEPELNGERLADAAEGKPPAVVAETANMVAIGYSEMRDGGK